MRLIRRGLIADAAALAQLEERTFRDAFEQTNTAEDMALHCAAHYSEAHQRRELSDPNLDVLVCDENGTLAGYAQLRRGAVPDCIPPGRVIEIQRFYVLKDWHGRGLAQELMTASLALAESKRADQVWLGVWEHNPRAIAFYKKWGFREAGSHIFPLGNDPQRDIIMTRKVEQ